MVINRFLVLVPLLLVGCIHPDPSPDATPWWLRDFSLAADGAIGDGGSSADGGDDGSIVSADLSGAVDGSSVGGVDLVSAEGGASADLSAPDLLAVDLVPSGPPSDVIVQIQGTGKTVTRNALDVAAPEFVVTSLTGWYPFGGFVIKRGGTGSIQGVVSARMIWKEANASFACTIDWNQNNIRCAWQAIVIPKNVDQHFQLIASYGWNQADGTHIYDLPDAASLLFVEKLKIAGAPVNNPAKVVVEIKPRGELIVQVDGPPLPTIAIGGTMLLMHQIKICALYEGALVDLINGTLIGQSAYKVARFKRGGALFGERVVPGGDKNQVDVNFNLNTLPIPINDCVSAIQGEAGLQPVVGWFQGNGMGVAPYSGTGLAFGITAGKQDGEWDANYAGKFNVRATGSITKSRLYADAPQGTLYNPSGATPPLSTLRKSKPTIVRVPCPNQQQNPFLVVGDTDLICFQISGSQAGEIGWNKITLNLTAGVQGQNKIQLSTCRLRRGVSDFQEGQVKFVDCNGADVNAGMWDSSKSCKQVAVVPLNEENVAAGQVVLYGVHCTVGGLIQKGDALSVAFHHPATAPVTGQLTGDPPNLLVGNATIPAAFIWSDHSDLPGGPMAHDHASEAQVEDLSGSVTLVKP